MARRPAGRDRPARRAIAEFLQLTPLLDRPSAGLSVNILQRLAIGRSAIVEPAIFLLDEPLSNVDAAFRAVMRTELKHLQRQFKQTMVYVTHDQLEAMTMADRIAVMDHGVLQQVGTPLEVYNDPANLFVARFIGSPGMNLLAGSLARERPRPRSSTWAPLGLSPAAACAALATPPAAGRPDVLYGFRPEQVQSGNGRRGTGACRSTFVERIGARTVVHLGEGSTAGKGRVRRTSACMPDETAHLARAAVGRLFDAARRSRQGEA